MTELESRIDALGSDQAVALLRRIVRAMPPPAATPGFAPARVDALFKTLSVAADSVDPPSEGELARSALRVLASDDRFRDALAALLAQVDPMRTFAPGGKRLETADVVAVLETQLAPVSQPAVAHAADGGRPEGRHSLVRGLARQLAAYAGFAPAAPQADAEYRVWFATSRTPLDATNSALGFGVERDSRIHYGSCRVFIPRSHKVGALGSPWWKRLVTFPGTRWRSLRR